MQEFTLTLSPTPVQRQELLQILSAFEAACATVRQIAAKGKTRHQAALHALAYRTLCPAKRVPSGLPSQYAIRAISRVSHQLREEAAKAGDPYPSRSFDVDGRSASLNRAFKTLAIATPDGRHLRGKAAQEARLGISIDLPQEILEAVDTPRIAGATVVLPKNRKPYVILRLR